MEIVGKGLGFFLSRRLFTPSLVRGGHRPDGTVLLWGPGFKGVRPPRAHIWEVAPLVLRLLGLAPPATMEDGALVDLFLHG